MTIRDWHRVFTPAAGPVRRRSSDQVETREDLLNGATVFDCFYCGKNFAARDATLEHVVPLSHGGTYHRDNCALSCARCNHLRNVLVTKIVAGKPFREADHPAYLWKGIVCVAGAYHFEVAGGRPSPPPRMGNVVQTTFRRTDARRRGDDGRRTASAPKQPAPAPRAPEAIAAEARQADIGWFKEQIRQVGILARTEPIEASYLANAIGSIPRGMSPTRTPEAVERFIRNSIEERRAFYGRQDKAVKTEVP